MNIDYLIGKRKFNTFTDIDKDFHTAIQIYKRRGIRLSKKEYVNEVLGNPDTSYDEMILLKKWLKRK